MQMRHLHIIFVDQLTYLGGDVAPRLVCQAAWASRRGPGRTIARCAREARPYAAARARPYSSTMRKGGFSGNALRSEDIETL